MCGVYGALWVALVACGSPVPTVASPVPSTFEARRKSLNADLAALRQDLSNAGRYDCCVANPCGHCALFAGGCQCGPGLRHGDPVCEECGYLWLKGQGAEPGIDPATVRTFYEAEKWPTGRICGQPTADGAPRR